MYGFGVDARLPPSFNPTEKVFGMYNRKYAGFKRSNIFENCCGGGDSSQCVDDLSPESRAADEARVSK